MPAIPSAQQQVSGGHQARTVMTAATHQIQPTLFRHRDHTPNDPNGAAPRQPAAAVTVDLADGTELGEGGWGSVQICLPVNGAPFARKLFYTRKQYNRELNHYLYLQPDAARISEFLVKRLVCRKLPLFYIFDK